MFMEHDELCPGSDLSCTLTCTAFADVEIMRSVLIKPALVVQERKVNISSLEFPSELMTYRGL